MLNFEMFRAGGGGKLVKMTNCEVYSLWAMEYKGE